MWLLPPGIRRAVVLAAGVCTGLVGISAETRLSPDPLHAGAVSAIPELESKRLTVRRLACEARIPPGFALAVLDKESGFNNAMRGSMGEIGASQILPATAHALGLDVRRLGAEFAYNAKAGISILRSLLHQSQGDQSRALCHYRAGPGWLRLPPRAQRRVRAYVADVIGLMKTRYAGVSCQ